MTVVGFALAGAALVTSEMARAVRPEALSILVALAVVGSLLLVGGIVYAMVRQLRRRRLLAADRYRGPSVVLLLALALVLGTAVTIPFSEDAAALVVGPGRPSVIGALVVMTSLQVALLLVTWLFVVAPRVLAFAVPPRGADWLPALRAGLGWGALAWLAASAVTLLLVLALDAIGVELPPPPAEQAIAALDPWLVVLAVVIVAPIGEEVFFRGVAFNAWLRERGPRFAYVASAILFASLHLSLVSLLPIFLLGLSLAWVYRRTRSLAGPIAMHATVNGISVAIALLIRYEVVRVPA